MRTTRFFCDTINQTEAITISGIQFRHLYKVLRLKPSDIVELFDGKGTVADAVIEKITKDAVVLKIQTKKVFNPRSNRRIIIAVSMAKAQRFEQVIEMCSQLGIDKITPVIFERTVKQADSRTAVKRFESIAIESAKQCGRNFLPIIDRPLSFEEALKILKTDYPQAKIIFGSLAENAASIINFKFDSQDVITFIGPEGGLTQAEGKTLIEINAEPARLGDTVLRIETAAIAFASILAAKRGTDSL